MNRPPAVLWIGVVLLLLLPTAAGRLLLDLAGGVLLALLALPLILSGLGWIGWKLLQSRMISCTACGATGLKGAAVCACLLYTSPSPRDMRRARMPSSA